jgi:ABC-2 type transport system ATP-binding protein
MSMPVPDQLPRASSVGMSDVVIECHGVTKRFGRVDALSGLDICVPRGCVYALLGRNGAGKSTLIQLLMGMLEPTAGTISVLGLDPVRNDVALKQKLGYIPERMPMYGWMTVGELIRFVAGIYSGWSADDESELVTKFRLRRDQKVRDLSRGNLALLCLVIAIAHRPELVLLDECTSGMDAITRQEFERSVIDTLSVSGRTVLFAGHQIDEMERICDWAGIVRDGKMLLQMPLDELKRTVKILRLSCNGEGADVVPSSSRQTLAVPGCRVLNTRKLGRELLATVQITSPEIHGVSVPKPYALLEEIDMSLEEIFVALLSTEEDA